KRVVERDGQDAEPHVPLRWQLRGHMGHELERVALPRTPEVMLRRPGIDRVAPELDRLFDRERERALILLRGAVDVDVRRQDDRRELHVATTQTAVRWTGTRPLFTKVGP